MTEEQAKHVTGIDGVGKLKYLFFRLAKKLSPKKSRADTLALFAEAVALRILSARAFAVWARRTVPQLPCGSQARATYAALPSTLSNAHSTLYLRCSVTPTELGLVSVSEGGPTRTIRTFFVPLVLTDGSCKKWLQRLVSSNAHSKVLISSWTGTEFAACVGAGGGTEFAACVGAGGGVRGGVHVVSVCKAAP